MDQDDRHANSFLLVSSPGLCMATLFHGVTTCERPGHWRRAWPGMSLFVDRLSGGEGSITPTTGPNNNRGVIATCRAAQGGLLDQDP